MELIVVEDSAGLASAAADIVVATIERRPEAVILAATGDTPMGCYADLARRHAAGDFDPARSRGGILELELAVDVIDALVDDRGTIWPVNVPNRGGVMPGFAEDLVVEVTGRVSAAGVEPIAVPALPRRVRGLIEALGEYQALTAEAAWSGARRDGIRALASHPLVLTLPKAETIYAEMALAHQAHLPERLLR